MFALRMTGIPNLVFVSDPADAHSIFLARPDVLHAGEGGAAIMPIVGRRSFTLADNEPHLHGRRILAPAFTQKAAEAQTTAIRDITDREVASWPRDTPITLHPSLRALSLRVILQTVFGSEDARLRELHARLLTMLSVVEHNVVTVPPARYLPAGHRAWRRFPRQRQHVDELIYELIEERQRDRADREDTLALLLAARDADGAPLSPSYLRDTVMTVLLAGHETTASELPWAIQLLAHHPEVVERLVSELDTTDSSEYLDAIIHEVLRHRPVFPFAVPRAVKAPIQIGRQTFAPPAHLVPCMHLVHHDPRHYATPHDFRPERFLGRRPDPRTWLPWGGGRRRCLGMHLAMVEMRVVPQTLFSSVAVRPTSPTLERPKWRSGIVTPHGGCAVILRDRNHHRRRSETAA